MENAYELAQYFVYHITEAKVGVEARINSAVTSIQALTDLGWSIYEIKLELEQFKNDYPNIVTNVYHINEIMDKKQPPNNLIEQDVFYYHNSLRETSPPVVFSRDENGRLIRKSEPFYLEMKKRFTFEELLNYWYKEMNIQPTEHIKRQDDGKFKYLLTNYTLDELLFAIDVSKTIRNEKRLRLLRNAFELDKYIEDAREAIRLKENVHKMQGINRVIKRQGEMYYD